MADVARDQRYDSSTNIKPANPPDKNDAAASKSAVSCTECQRRKQKCSKEWPCNHCQTRRVAHLCHFPPKSGSGSGSNKKDTNSAGVKRKGSGNGSSENTPPEMTEVPEDGLNDDMAEWGYMPGTNHFNVQQPAGLKFHNAVNGIQRNGSPVRQDQIDSRPSEIPNRSLADKLVHEYLNHFNFHYYCTYPPLFLEEYVDWWKSTASGQPVSKSFTSLLLRILACAVQWAKDEMKSQVEYEMAENAQSLTEKYFAAADSLSQQTAPGSGGLHQVEQLFLAACWLKAEARFIEAWHALGVAIREAQEQGLHRETVHNGVSTNEWEHALRRRMWCILYVWDFYMAGWLGRPLIIDQNNCHIDTKLLRIDQAGTGSDAPDPFAHVTIQCELIQIVSVLFIKFGAKPTPSDLLELQARIDEWRSGLPLFLKLEAEDTTFDANHKFVQHQRLQLHATVMMMRLNPLKPYLVHPVDPASTAEDDELRQQAVQKSLDLLSVTFRLFDLGVDPKDHLVIFCLFDTAATACSGVVHGIGKFVDREEELRDAINGAIARLAELAQVSRPGAMAWRILSRLVRRLPEDPRDGKIAALSAPLNKRLKKERSSALPEEQFSAPDLVVEPVTLTVTAVNPNGAAADDTGPLAPDPSTSRPEDALPWISPDEFNPNGGTFTSQGWEVGGNFSEVNFEGLEQVWDWQGLNLDPFNARPS